VKVHHRLQTSATCPDCPILLGDHLARARKCPSSKHRSIRFQYTQLRQQREDSLAPTPKSNAERERELTWEEDNGIEGVREQTAGAKQGDQCIRILSPLGTGHSLWANEIYSQIDRDNSISRQQDTVRLGTVYLPVWTSRVHCSGSNHRSRSVRPAGPCCRHRLPGPIDITHAPVQWPRAIQLSVWNARSAIALTLCNGK